MSDNCQSHDDFTLISYKRGRKSRKNPKIVQDTTSFTPPNRDNIKRRIEDSKSELFSSDLFASSLASLRESLIELQQPTITEIICFGLGRIGECVISRYQFAFLLCLREVFKGRIRVYDPVFTDVDLWLLGEFACEVLPQNVEGKWGVDQGKTTLFYLPHCPRQLTNNLLWANWGLNLHYCIVIANSFNAIIERSTPAVLSSHAELISNITPHCIEYPIINSFKYFEIFNDTAVHVFPLKKLEILAGEFWSSPQEPHYADDVEFIQNNVNF